MKVRLSYLFAMLAVSYNASVYSGTDLYHVFSSRIEIIQGSEIFGNGEMQSKVRIKYKLNEEVTLISIKLKEFGTGVELDELKWTVTETDNGFDHNIQGSSRHNDNTPLLKNNEKYIVRYISTRAKNENINVCYEIKTRKNTEEGTFTSCFDEADINGNINIYSRRPKYYSAQDFFFVKVKVLFEYFREMVSTYYTLKNTSSIPNGMSFKLAPLIWIIPPGEVALHQMNKSAMRKFNQQDLKLNHSGYLYILQPHEFYFLKAYPGSMDSYAPLRANLQTTFEKTSPLHIILTSLTNTATYHNTEICFQRLPGLGRQYACRDQDNGVAVNRPYADVVDGLVEQTSKQVLIDNYGTKHQIVVRVDDDVKPSL